MFAIIIAVGLTFATFSLGRVTFEKWSNIVKKTFGKKNEE